jgi:hypothetical protein
MTDSTITNLPAAAPLTGTELYAADQGAGTVKISAQQQAALAGYSSNTTLSVPGTYADINAALAAISGATISNAAAVTISVAAGRYAYNSPVSVQSPYGKQIFIAGAASATSAISNSTAGSGVAGAWSVKYTIPSSAGIQANDIVGVEGASGGASAPLHEGAWVVSSVPDGTHIIVTNTTWSVAPPSGITATLRVYPTQLKFNGCAGFLPSHLGGLSNMAIQGDTLTLNTIGIDDSLNDVSQPGKALIGPYVAVNGFNAEGVRANYGGIVFATYVTVAGCGNNGFLARDLGHVFFFPTCISSGNGFTKAPGGGSGALAENTSSMLLFGTRTFGNYGDGVMARTASAALFDNSSPGFSAFNNRNGYRASVLGYLQNNGGTAYGNTLNGWQADGGSINAASSAADSSTQNGYSASAGGQMQVSGSTAFNQGGAYAGFNADGNGTAINASGSNVTGTVGSFAYLATHAAEITMTGPLGFTTASPTPNSSTPAAPGTAFIIN